VRKITVRVLKIAIAALAGIAPVSSGLAGTAAGPGKKKPEEPKKIERWQVQAAIAGGRLIVARAEGEGASLVSAVDILAVSGLDRALQHELSWPTQTERDLSNE
jgi:hypothetical protein